MVQYRRYRLKRLFIMHCDYSAMTMVGYAGRGPPMALMNIDYQYISVHLYTLKAVKRNSLGSSSLSA